MDNKQDKKKLVIDVANVDKSSYDALSCFADEFGHTEVGKLVKQWLDDTAWDVSAWYIGDDL